MWSYCIDPLFRHSFRHSPDLNFVPVIADHSSLKTFVNIPRLLTQEDNWDRAENNFLRKYRKEAVSEYTDVRQISAGYLIVAGSNPDVRNSPIASLSHFPIIVEIQSWDILGLLN